MSYIRHDKDNNPVSPQPSANSLTRFSGCEGWSQITYSVWNGDYVARNSDNTIRTPGVFQARNSDNTIRTPATYQRHDINNQPINDCEIGEDDPANAAEPDATAWVLMDGPFYNTTGDPNSGFVGGQSWRKMAPSADVNGKTSYIYGDETVTWTGPSRKVSTICPARRSTKWTNPGCGVFLRIFISVIPSSGSGSPSTMGIFIIRSVAPIGKIENLSSVNSYSFPLVLLRLPPRITMVSPNSMPGSSTPSRVSTGSAILPLNVNLQVYSIAAQNIDFGRQAKA